MSARLLVPDVDGLFRDGFDGTRVRPGLCKQIFATSVKKCVTFDSSAQQPVQGADA
jgi:hypothetical protein